MHRVNVLRVDLQVVRGLGADHLPPGLEVQLDLNALDIVKKSVIGAENDSALPALSS